MEATTRTITKSETKERKHYVLLDGADPDISRIIRVTLYYLDGSESFMVMQTPNFTHWHHVHVEAAEAIINIIFSFKGSDSDQKVPY